MGNYIKRLKKKSGNGKNGRCRYSGYLYEKTEIIKTLKVRL